MAESTHYETLGVSRSADRETVRRAYLVIARANHPDRHASEQSQRTDAERKIRAANAAWNVLGDPVKRREYDLSLPDRIVPRAPQNTRPNLEDHRPPPPSGIVVSAHTAPLWKWGPIVVAVLIGAALIIGSAYATSQDPASVPTSTPATTNQYVPGSCVLILAGPSGKIAQLTSCDQQFSSIVSSQVDSPRPCPPLTVEVPLAGGKTTLCLVGAR